jgi:hypothetical protein
MKSEEHSLLMPVRVVLGAIQKLVARFLITASPKVSVHSVTLVNVATQAKSEELFQRLKEALDLLSYYAPVRLWEIQRHLKYIVVAHSPGSAYWSFAKACAVGEATVLGQPSAWLASVILHEAMHARLAAKGIQYSSAQRERIERYCVARQSNFLRKIPGTEPLVEHLQSWHALDWYSDPQYYERQAARLSALGAPPSVVSWVRRRGKASTPEKTNPGNE